MALASRPTRWRGRRWLLLGVFATIVVLAVNAAMSARSPTPARELAEQSYLDQILPAIQQSTQDGMDVATVRTQALKLGATTITDRLHQVATSAQRTLAQVRNLTPPRSLQTAHDLLIATLAIRAEGVDGLSAAMAAAMSGHAATEVVPSVVDVGRDYDAADRAYALFVKAMPGLGVPLPASVWMTDPSAYTDPVVAVFLASLQAAASLTPVHDASVVLFITDPLPVNPTSNPQVLPISKSLNLQIVVADVGNQPEKNLTVTATIAPSTSGPTEMVRDFVDLVPGQRRTVKLGGLRPQPGVPTTLTVKIDAAPGQVNVADTTKTIAFVMQ